MIVDTEFNSAAQIPAGLCVDAAVLAEQAGFGCVWKGEANGREPMVQLAAMAARTHRIQLGTAVHHVYSRTPVTLAMQAATLNELSGGRLILGLGVANPVIAAWHGDTFDRPLARLREYVQVLRAAHSGERVPDYDGDFQKTSRSFKLAFDPAHPLALWIAGIGPQMARLAGELGDGVVINIANERLIPEIVENLREGARRGGRDPDACQVVAKLRVALHPDVDQARSSLKKVLTFYALQRGYGEALVRMGWEQIVRTVKETHRTQGFAAARQQIPDEMVDDVPMYASDSLDGLGERLAAFERAGCTRLVVAYVPASDDLRGELTSFIDQMRAGGHVSGMTV